LFSLSGTRMSLYWLGLFIFLVQNGCESKLTTFIKMPNQADFWKKSGFQKIVGPLHLPTNTSQTTLIQVWLKVPQNGKISVEKINDSRNFRYTLIYPPGTVADRVEFMTGSNSNLIIRDVRGARIDEKGNTVFHVYRLVPKFSTDWLIGYEWLRKDDLIDVRAGEALVKIFHLQKNKEMKNHFIRRNHCSNCHRENSPIPLNTLHPYRHESDSRGFFQPISVFKNETSVRNHRVYDLNADDPFISVWCGEKLTHAKVQGKNRWYECQGNQTPMGRLDLARALKAGNKHAIQLCNARTYLYYHMDKAARDAVSSSFRECLEASGNQRVPLGQK
jgi:hypothetical protein